MSIKKTVDAEESRDRHSFFSVVASNRASGERHKQDYGKFHFKMRGLSMLIVVKHCKRLFSSIVGYPTLEILKPQLYL